jgi:anthranilate synthase/aminodeoxychorismate synthase-like glutamine amidotransferase
VKPRLLLIDNYDSFTYNLVQAFMVLGAEVSVFRNDALSTEAARALAPTHLCISPGPGTPYDAGVSMDMIRTFAGRIPVLGVCLGHQAIAEVFGARVVRATRLMHGKTSLVRHDGRTLFAGLPQPCEVGRYHSLIAAPESLPADLEVSATTEEGEIMAVRHRALWVEGVQFHPESILTPDGPRLLGNFLQFKDGARHGGRAAVAGSAA